MPTIMPSPSDLPDAQQQYGKRLQAAIETGDLATVSQLLNAWPTQPNAEANSGDKIPSLWPFKAVLSGAVERGNAELAAHVLGRGIKIELYAVMRAESLRSAEMFQVFIDHGWDINMPLGEKFPPCLSQILDNEDLIRWFLAHGASPNAPASLLFVTPMMLACGSASLPTVKLLFAYGASHDNLLVSAAESNAEERLKIMEFLLDQGADINAVKWQHHEFSYESFGGAHLGTALHNAVAGGFVDRVELLLQRGARTDIPDSMGSTAIDIALRFGFYEIRDMLINSSVA